jgi:ABC-type Na+ efflux pump permease subunit
MINRTLIESFWRERLTSIPRMALVLAGLSLNLLNSTLTGSGPPDPSSSALFLVFILGAGIIGRDVSSGTLHLILVRPVSRSEYVLSRWLGLAAIASFFALVQLVLISAIAMTHGTLPATSLLMTYFTEQVVLILGSSAVLVFLSTLVGGNGDIVLLAAGMMAGGMAAMIGTGAQVPWLATLGTEMGQFLVPHIDLTAISSGDYQDPARYVIYWFVSVAVSLTLAITVITRRDFSYATAG